MESADDSAIQRWTAKRRMAWGKSIGGRGRGKRNPHIKGVCSGVSQGKSRRAYPYENGYRKITTSAQSVQYTYLAIFFIPDGLFLVITSSLFFAAI